MPAIVRDILQGNITWATGGISCLIALPLS